MIQNDWTLQDEQVCKQAADFIRLYYDVMDRKRERISHMYLDDLEVTLVWNGNCLTGADAISRFLTTFPITQHDLITIDAQKIPMAAIGATSDYIVVSTAGSVQVQEATHAFTESFTLVMDGTTLKIKTQKFRYVD